MVYEVMMLVVYMWYGVYVQLCSGGGCCYEKERGGWLNKPMWWGGGLINDLEINLDKL